MEELFRIELYYRKRPFCLVMSSEKKTLRREYSNVLWVLFTTESD